MKEGKLPPRGEEVLEAWGRDYKMTMADRRTLISMVIDEARLPLVAAIRLMIVRHHDGAEDAADCDVCSAALRELAR